MAMVRKNLLIKKAFRRLNIIFQMEIKIFHEAMLVQQSTYDLCDGKIKPDLVRSNMVGWSIPSHCPMKEPKTFCQKGSKIFTLSKTTQRLFSIFSASSKGMKILITIQHYSGSSCFMAMSKLTKIN